MTNLKVLVIDDDVMTCNLLETILQMEDYQTAALNRVEPDIITVLNQARPDLLILDYHMGPQDTLGLVRTIRATPEWQALPVLMTSAIDRRQDCRAAGADEFLLKPFRWQEVIRLVEDLTSHLKHKEV